MAEIVKKAHWSRLRRVEAWKAHKHMSPEDKAARERAWNERQKARRQAQHTTMGQALIRAGLIPGLK